MSSDPSVSFEELDARLRRVETAVEDLDSLALPESAPPAIGPVGAVPEPVFGNVETWVLGWFIPTFVRSPGQGCRWCARWWDHAEAIVRLEAMWRAWERLRLDPGTGMGIWLREFCDPLLAQLVDDRGPFARCTPDRHDPPPPLIAEVAPPGHWDTDDPPAAGERAAS